MKINIKYFGLLAEITGRKEDNIEFSGTLAQDLRDTLLLRYEELNQSVFHIVENKEILSNNTLIKSNEIVLLPPFAGG